MRAWDIVGYTFQAENYTPRGVLEALYSDERFDGWRPIPPAIDVEDELREIAAAFPQYVPDYDDPSSYDSDDFPKPFFADQLANGELLIDERGQYVDPLAWHVGGPLA